MENDYVTDYNSERKPNKLITEKSTYLLQHARNPVDWHPWSNEAFEYALKTDKPVFVSIGYSSCHWCHVMERESFEDQAVADLMNRAFVCIKVDREERPDLDAVYMAICQVMGRNCGWPLNVIMTPTKNPFFVASYIPKYNRFGSIGMLDLIPQIEEIWKTRRKELEIMGTEIYERIAIQPKVDSSIELSKVVLDEGFNQLFLAYDHENSGFGRAPKFPTPHNLLFLLRYYNRTKQPTALSMVEKTLVAMRLGGIFDQVGLGFHRYSTDAKWLVPHFEKMLYDQALLVLAYLEAYQITRALKFKITAKETLNYVVQGLSGSEGAFFSSEDADSDGKEGEFYLWSLNEIKDALPVELVDFTIRLFGIRAEGNFYEPGKGLNKKNILHIALPLEQFALEENISVDQVVGRLENAVSLLFKERNKRIHPAKDRTILVDWNGLMIAAFANASQILGDQNYLKKAEKAADFILNNMQTNKHQLFHRYAKGEKAINGFLDDYAFLIYGLLEIYEASFDEKYLEVSINLAKVMIDEFWDDKEGGFYFTSKAGEKGIPRIKQSYDGAVPSGNSVALHVLLRLAALTDDVSFREYADKLLSVFASDIQGYPMGHTFMLAGLDFALGPSFNVTIVGDPADKDTKELLAALRRRYLPNLSVILWSSGRVGTTLQIDNYEKINDKATAYVCRNQTCLPPTNNITQLQKYLK